MLSLTAPEKKEFDAQAEGPRRPLAMPDHFIGSNRATEPIYSHIVIPQPHRHRETYRAPPRVVPLHMQTRQFDHAKRRVIAFAVVWALAALQQISK